MSRLTGLMGAIKTLSPKTFSNAFRYLILDPITHALVVISYPHREVHQGSAYWCYRNATIALGEVINIGLTTPDTTKWSHLLLEVRSSGGATFDILEDCTSLGGGNATTIYNFNRNSDNTSVNTAIAGETGNNPVTVVGGDSIWDEVLSSGQKISTSRENNAEIILKQNSNYRFQVTSAANGNTVTILLTWYEHTNKT